MEVNELKIGHWYILKGWLKINYCLYVFNDSKGHPQYVFYFLDGFKCAFSQRTVEADMTPCSESFSKYLNLFVLEDDEKDWYPDAKDGETSE